MRRALCFVLASLFAALPAVAQKAAPTLKAYFADASSAGRAMPTRVVTRTATSTTASYGRAA